MKKRLTAVLLVALVMLAGCGGYDNTSMDITKIDVDSYIETLGEYKGLTIETEPKMTITDNTVDDYINYVLSASGQTSTTEVDRAAKEGDIVNIDYEGIKDGVAFEGGTDTGYDLTLGSGKFIPGFEDGLIGYKKGDEVSLNLTFPEDYTEELAGAEVVFNVKINSVKEVTAATLTPEFIQGLGISGVTDEESFRSYIKENLETNAEDSYRNGLRDGLITQIAENTVFTDAELPVNLMNYYVGQIQNQDSTMASQYGVSLEEFVTTYYDMEFDEYEEQCRTQAETMLKDAIICEKIARIEGIKVSKKEATESLESDAERYGYESVDEYKQSFDEQDYRNYLLEIKVMDNLLESATIVEKTDE